MAIVMFALSLNIFEILAKQENYQIFDLENEGQGRVKERNLRHSTGNFQIHTGDFWRILVTSFTHKITHLHIPIGVITIGKICNADLPKVVVST